MNKEQTQNALRLLDSDDKTSNELGFAVISSSECRSEIIDESKFIEINDFDGMYHVRFSPKLINEWAHAMQRVLYQGAAFLNELADAIFNHIKMHKIPSLIVFPVEYYHQLIYSFRMPSPHYPKFRFTIDEIDRKININGHEMDFIRDHLAKEIKVY